MTLIQLLLPAVDGEQRVETERLTRTRHELVDRFGGITAYLRAPAQGVWTSSEGHREQDHMIMVEIVTKTLDRTWWRQYTAELARRFEQEVIHVRALQIEVLNDDVGDAQP